MSETALDSATKHRVVEQLIFLLKAFHEAEEKNEGGFESVSRRGQLGGFRHALETLLGRSVTHEILDAVRSQTQLGFPHVGPVQDDGSILGFDSEAAPGL
jgi:hypothetical protein